MDQNAPEIPIRDAQGLESILEGLAGRIAQGRTSGAPLRLVGLRSRGFPLATRLAARLRQGLGVDVPVGAVDITMYRDDLGRGDRWPVIQGTDIAFEVDDAEIVLVDDVLFTGRSVRAALNTVCDLGRPACVRLAVVVDRGGRELPIRADYTGLDLPTDPVERVVVRVRPVDPVDGIVKVRRPRTH